MLINTGFHGCYFDDAYCNDSPRKTLCPFCRTLALLIQQSPRIPCNNKTLRLPRKIILIKWLIDWTQPLKFSTVWLLFSFHPGSVVRSSTLPHCCLYGRRGLWSLESGGSAWWLRPHDSWLYPTNLLGVNGYNLPIIIIGLSNHSFWSILCRNLRILGGASLA